ncbi:MAG: hypothetical protein D6704_05905 [Nitrospirae bacterium]|nr:MAG: hypothetical protein D6704_05905 [Nitrospirota bacterium]
MEEQEKSMEGPCRGLKIAHENVSPRAKHRYHLWLIPETQVASRVKAVIDHLSETWHAPRFAPHLTLWGGIEGEHVQVQLAASRLASTLAPLSLEIAAPAYGMEYFRCVYLRVVETPALRQAHTQARTLFGCREATTFSPHISVLYGRYSDTVKQRVVATLSNWCGITFETRELSLIRSESEDPQDWHVIATFPLSRRPESESW